MESKVNRYYQLKKKQKEIEKELAELRDHILEHCEAADSSELVVGGYNVKIVQQQRKEYDDAKLYAALPDPDIWRMLSKVDTTKLASLLNLNVISEDRLKDTFSTRTITMLQVVKR